jgi:hypothetical protein
MHTLGQYGYAVSMIFACLGLITASVIGAYGMLALAFASDVRVDNGRYYAVLPTSEIRVNWQLPGVFAVASCLWALVALGFHAL